MLPIGQRVQHGAGCQSATGASVLAAWGEFDTFAHPAIGCEGGSARSLTVSATIFSAE
jgi:hypothetical protein